MRQVQYCYFYSNIFFPFRSCTTIPKPNHEITFELFQSNVYQKTMNVVSAAFIYTDSKKPITDKQSVASLSKSFSKFTITLHAVCNIQIKLVK